jgi:hypothetical protein
MTLRHPGQKPAADLFRVTAVLVAVLVPVFELLLHSGVFAPRSSPITPDGPVPAIEVSWSAEADWSIWVTWVTELILIVGYLVTAVARRTVAVGAAVRWGLLAWVIVFLAYIWFWSLAVSTDPVICLWLVAPLVFFAVHRAHPAGTLWVLAGLLLSAVETFFLTHHEGSALAGLPLVMIVGAGVVLGVRRLR